MKLVKQTLLPGALAFIFLATLLWLSGLPVDERHSLTGRQGHAARQDLQGRRQTGAAHTADQSTSPADDAPAATVSLRNR